MNAEMTMAPNPWDLGRMYMPAASPLRKLCRPAPTRPAARLATPKPALLRTESEALALQRRRLQHQNTVLRESLRQREAVAFRASHGDVTARLALGIFASKPAARQAKPAWPKPAVVPTAAEFQDAQLRERVAQRQDVARRAAQGDPIAAVALALR